MTCVLHTAKFGKMFHASNVVKKEKLLIEPFWKVSVFISWDSIEDLILDWDKILHM